jgi:hypothetical protein
MATPRITPVDLSGHASTIANDELTVGEASKVKAYAGGFAPDPRSPAGRQLLAALKAQAADTSTVDGEARARRKGAKSIRKQLKAGSSVEVAIRHGHSRYRAHGGRLGIASWRRAELGET